MGQICKITPVKLIIGLITGDENNFKLANEALSEKFGAIDYVSPIFDFNFTDYYQKEIGVKLKRCFFSFAKLISPEQLSRIKLITNKIEKRYSKDGKRSLNIDPGYITSSKLILATTKDYCHRIYLGKGIFAEVTLRFKEKSFIPGEWTYPDYKTKDYIEAFNRIREIYMQQIKGKKGTAPFLS